MRRLYRFWRDERGAGTVFMVAMLPVFLALAGLAIDSANAYRVRNILQGAADAASMAATLALPDTNAATQAAITYAKLNLPNYGNILASADVETGSWDSTKRIFTNGAAPLNAVRVTTRMTAANGNALPTTFLNIIGINHWDVAAQAISVADQPKMWVALVLDNSTSMCEPGASPCATPSKGSKIAALKTGAGNLLKTLKAASVHDGDVKVSIVPFTKNVSVGPSYVNATWLNWADFTKPPPGIPGDKVGPGSACPWKLNIDGFQCQANPTNDSNAQNIRTPPVVPSSGTYKGYICPTADDSGHFYNGCYNSVKTGGSGANTTYKHSWIPNNKNTWTGCLMDRDQNYDVSDALPSNGGTMFWPENTTNCPMATVTPLHTLATDQDLSDLTGQINKLAASGWTNQTIGVDFGWLTLTPGMPLSPATPALPRDTQRYIILFSDGLNTINRWHKSSHTNVADAVLDERTMTACKYAKEQGIVIFTVYVDISGGAGSDTALKACASDPKDDYYFPLTSANAIITTFDKIGRKIMKMRLVH
jgi:Flp pilus assembly protein TadG